MPAQKFLESSIVAVRDALPPSIRAHIFNEDSFAQRATPFITAFGAAALTYYSVKSLLCVGKGITSYFLAGPFNLGADLKKSGDWAVITGGSDGIGKEFAFQLAQKGLNMVLVARNLEKLEGVAREISVKYNVQTKIIAIDLAKMGPHNVPQMQEELKDLNISVLINVAGVFGSPGRFLHNPTTDEDAANLVNLNARAVVMMCRAVMPLMLSRGASPSNRHYVINVGGILGGVAPTAGFALYGASKAFLDSFSQALNFEYCPLGISVQSLIPGATLTKILPFSCRGNRLVATTAEVVYGSLTQLGLRSRTFGHWKHGLQGCLAGIHPVINFLAHVPA